MTELAGPRNPCFDTGALIVATAQGAGTQTSPDQSNPSARGIAVTVDITAKTGTISVVCNIYRKDTASGKYVTLLSSAALTGTGTTTMIVHPDLTAAANTIVKDFIGATWKVDLVHGAGSTPATTATVGACLLP
jgi:hypothetical protein